MTIQPYPPATLDIANSYIDFSSSETFEPSLTTSIAFGDSLTDITSSGGGDVKWRINRNSLLPNVSLNNIRAIRFRLVSNGDPMEFIASAMRVVPDTFTFEEIDVDTKRKYLMRSVPLAGGTEPGISFEPIFFDETKPKNLTLLTKFHSGHRPTTNNTYNEIEYRLRVANSSNYISVRFRHGQSGTGVGESTLAITEWINGTGGLTMTTPLNSNNLINETDYFVKIELEEDKIRASVFEGSALPAIGDLVYTTNWQTLVRVTRGYVGYDFIPYNYDFYLEYIQPTYTQFAQFISNSFPSVKGVQAATIYRHDSGYVDLAEDIPIIGSGDGLLSTEELTGDPPPSRKIVRDGSAWFGGVEFGDSLFLGDTREVLLKGSIFPKNARGLWRLALVDEYDSVGYLAHMEGFIANAWNHFEVPIAADLVPTKWYLLIHQAGFYADTFYVDNLRTDYNTVSWLASADDGVLYSPFMHVDNEPYIVS